MKAVQILQFEEQAKKEKKVEEDEFSKMFIFQKRTQEEIERANEVLAFDQVATEKTLESLKHAGEVGAAAYHLYIEMEQFGRENKEWLREENLQLASKTEDLTGKEKEILARAKACQERYLEYKK